MTEVTIRGVIKPGYGIASWDSKKTQELVSNVYPDGRKIIVDKTVYRQFPFFCDAGVAGIERMHPGTINIDISPREFSLVEPDYKITCEWIPGIRETFWLTGVTLIHNEKQYPAYIYYPCISEQHVARNFMIEVIAEKIEGVAYDDDVLLVLDTRSIQVSN
jgi:hypothetical protein